MKNEEEESKRLRVGGASNLEKSVAKLTDNASALGEEVAKTKVQNTIQIDPALEAFDRLRLKRIETNSYHTASAFLAEFQSIAASLEPDERIKLVIYAYESSMELLKAVLSHPQANKICSLLWDYSGEEDVNSIIPLLISNCPELALLKVGFKHSSEFDFVSSLLEHPSNKIKVLDMLKYIKGDIPRFFVALGQSQVSALTLFYSPEFAQGFCEYLARDLLVRFMVWGCSQVLPELLVSLSKCTRLTKLEMLRCNVSQPTAFTHLPKSITTLTLASCRFAGGFDWSFLAGSNVRELDFDEVEGVDGNQFGDALAVHLGAKGLDKLRLRGCRFADETLAVVGVELGRIKMLEITKSANDASIKLITLALQSPNCEVKELVLKYAYSTMNGIENHLVPALKHPNCNLVRLRLQANQHKEAAKKVEDMFRKRRALFVLLQGRQAVARFQPNFCANAKADQEADLCSKQEADLCSKQEADQGTNRKANQSTNQGAKQEADQGTNQSANQGAKQETNQSADQSAKQETNQSANQSASQSVNQSANQGANQSANRETKQEAEHNAEQEINRETHASFDKGSDRETHAPVDKGAEQTKHDANQTTSHDDNQATKHDANQTTKHDADQATNHGANQPANHDDNQTTKHDANQATKHDANQTTHQKAYRQGKL